MSIIVMIIFYVLLIIVLKNYYKPRLKLLLSGILLMFGLLIINWGKLPIATKVVFLDLQGGEATIIHAPKEQCIAVIDTGTGENQVVTNYLKSEGIFTIDYLFLTHNHHDHNGEAKTMMEELTIKNIVVSRYDQSNFANYANYKVKKNDKINCGKITFEIFHPYQPESNINNESIVMRTTIGGLSFVFMGDVESSSEQQLLSQNIQADVIKIGHHGSNTSSKVEFLRHVNPRYAIIQTGRLQYLGFPHKQTITNLNSLGIIIFRTDVHYSITFEKHFQKWKIKPLRKIYS
jgi:competence protein ComEC